MAEQSDMSKETRLKLPCEYHVSLKSENVCSFSLLVFSNIEEIHWTTGHNSSTDLENTNIS